MTESLVVYSTWSSLIYLDVLANTF
jgi:hypothetical protein